MSMGMLRTAVKHGKVRGLNKVCSELEACPHPAPSQNISPFSGNRNSCAAESLGNLHLCTPSKP